jgi:hypothetical protein
LGIGHVNSVTFKRKRSYAWTTLVASVDEKVGKAVKVAKPLKAGVIVSVSSSFPQ